MSSYYSYNKLLLVKGPVVGSLIFIIGFILSIILPNLLTFEHFISKSKYYKQNIKKISCLSKEKKDSMGFTWLKKIIKNLNMYFTFGQHNIKNFVCDSLTFASINIFGLDVNFIKLYMILLGSSSSLLLMKIISNYAINTIISTTIPGKNTSVMIKMILYYFFNLFIISIPVIFTYCAFGHGFFDISNWKAIWNNFDTFSRRISNHSSKGFFLNTDMFFEEVGFKSHQFFKVLLLIIKIIIVGLVMIFPLIYIFYNLNLFNIPILDEYIGSMKSICSGFLKSHFNDIDSQYIENIYNFKDNMFINLGIWIFIFIILFVIHYNMVNSIKNNYNKWFYLLIFIIIFIFIFHIVYKGYTYETQEIFDENGKLTEPITKSHSNNLLQSIVKYGYTCSS